MGKKLAIKGHSTRGEEIIELLKMMGGYKDSHLKDEDIYDDNYFYFILAEENNAIDGYPLKYKDKVDEDYVIFTLEEFLEKYPFKIHDLVNIPEYESEVDICGMRWDPTCQDVEYLVYRCDDEEWYTTRELLKYNDNPNKTRDCKKCGLHFGSVRCFAIDCPHNTPKSYAASLVGDKVIDNLTYKNIDMNTCKDTAREAHKKIAYLSINNEDYADQIEVDLGDNYEYKFEMNRLYIIKKKPEYPKTYKECCGVLGMTYDYPDIKMVSIYECSLYSSFIELIRCRDAYWKIAGKEMGLDGPWKPDWSTEKERKYVIEVYRNKVRTNSQGYSNTLSAFSTIEMRDAFYENFKDLIEQCKELL